ncbi:hypothetical protein LCGC14_0394150 [marine sediment metagenome]|uniref:Uncharacterized protein n=1 Tax=marine sediment metagenome TaxID=412755 RepID=A0A0F9SYR6_9ZZZZ
MMKPSKRLAIAVLALVGAWFVGSKALAGTISLGRVSTGDTITASSINDPRATLEATINGGIENVNISATAAISESKIAFTSGGHDHGGGSEGTPVVGVALQGYLFGLGISNAAGDTAHDIDIAVGRATDSTDSTNLAVSATLTAAIDTQGINGMDDNDDVTNDAEADTWYEVLVVQKSDGTAIGGYYNKIATSMNCPSGYTNCTFRIIGYVRTGSGNNIINFTRVGRYFRWDDPIKDVDDNTITNDTAETGTLTAPPTTLALVRLRVASDGDQGNFLFGGLVRPTGDSDTTANEDEFCIGVEAQSGDGSTDGVVGECTVLVDSNSQMEYMAVEDANTTTVIINTLGYWDTIGIE